MTEQKIIIPQFVQNIVLAEAKRTKYYERGSDQVPERYSGVNYEWKKTGGRGRYRLWDKRRSDWVIKNPASAGKPRIKSIAGNDIWMGVHERVRMKIVEAVKENFLPHLPSQINLRFPIRGEMIVYATPRFADWDIGNLWLYDKIFWDLLVREKLIPDDSILYVTKSGGPKYVPIVHEEDRRMEFILSEEDDPLVLSHIMYNLQPKSAILLPEPFMFDYKTYLIKEDSRGEPGSVFVQSDIKEILISTGKTKTIYGAARRAFKSLFSLCIQLNSHVTMTQDLFNKYRKFVAEELQQRGIQVYLYDDWAEVQGSSPNDGDSIHTSGN